MISDNDWGGLIVSLLRTQYKFVTYTLLIN